MSRIKTWTWAALLLAIGATFTAWLWSLGRHSDAVPFLPRQRVGHWIIFPKPLNPLPHRAISSSAVFQRSFQLESRPSQARLSIRAFKEARIVINGEILTNVHLTAQAWKRGSVIEIASLLRTGTNTFSITVSNAFGPPALWLSLEAAPVVLHTDSEWQVSLNGSIDQPAAIASSPPPIRPGNYLFGRERIVESIKRLWPGLSAVLIVSVAVIILGPRVCQYPSLRSRPWLQQLASPKGLVLLIALSWIVLLANNLPQLPELLGFDRDGHLQYIDYILQKHALPLANEGWQMYQPPLYYLLSALAVVPFSESASSSGAVLGLRVLSSIIGLAHLAIIFLCLRLLFPNQRSRQAIGLLIAGFMAANIYLSHHITNEGLSALLVTASLYFCLRLLKSETQSTRLTLAAGISLGLALLTKFSAIVALPFVLAAVAWPQTGAPLTGPALRSSLPRVALVLLGTVLTCGWHFARVGYHFGNPLIGNWDPKLPFAWWQEPGYRTAQWYCNFGSSLNAPQFSSLWGFADGLYSSCWGDGLCSGGVWGFRPPWNYHLMNVSYVLALIPTLLVIAGFLRSAAEFFRKPNPELLLFVGLLSAFAAALVYMTLKIPSYAQVKAFYALPALLPLCAFAARGWDLLSKNKAGLKAACSIGLLAWSISAYGAFWIRSGNAATPTIRGVGFADDGKYEEAIRELSDAVQHHPDYVPARLQLADTLQRVRRYDESSQQIAAVLSQQPEEPEAYIKLAVNAGSQGRYDQAAADLQRAIRRLPDHPTAYQQLATCFNRLNAPEHAVLACREGLRIDPFNPEIHYLLAQAASALRDFTNAIGHLHLALALKPERVEARALLAEVLTSSSEHQQAIAELEIAIRSKPEDANLHYLLAVNFNLQGETQNAIEQYREALRLEPNMVPALNNLAWILAVNPQDKLRNGAEAVRLAEKATELSGGEQPVFWGTLAAAYAEASRFQEAVATAQKAQALASKIGQPDVAEKNGELLQFYRSGKPYRETVAARP